MGNPCNRNCRQCFIGESKIGVSGIGEETQLAEKIIRANPNSNLFIYPKEISTSPELIELTAKVGQQYVLSNGLLTEEIFSKLKQNGLKRIRFSLYANSEEQAFWYGTTDEEYDTIKKTLRSAAQSGFTTDVFTIATPQNVGDIETLYSLGKELGISGIKILRLLPVGNARTIDKKFLMNEDTLEELLNITDSLKKKKGPYISFSMMFGPDFYSTSVWEYLKKGDESSWVKTKYLCPAIENNYVGISMKDSNIYWCFYLISDEEAVVGKVTQEGKLDIISNPELSAGTLKEKLRGICSMDACSFQDYCLGGCRAAAYTFGRLKGETEPIYAGMDICRTKLRGKRIQTKLL